MVGTATANPQAPGGVEVTEPTVTALSDAPTPRRSSCGATLNAGLPTLLDHAAVTWRHPLQRAKWELAAASLRGFRDTLDANGFTEVATPKLVESATECGANVFEVDYFGRPAYLAQSPQFYKQVLVGVFERVYEVGPVFRAEPHDTVRHLAEYVCLDVELGFIGDHRDVLACLRDVVAGMVAAVHEMPARPSSGSASTCRRCPTRSRCCTSAKRCDRRRARGRAGPGPGARARARRVGQGRARQRLPGRRGLPDGPASVLQPPRPRGPALGRSFDLIFRGLELVSGRAAAAPATTTTCARWRSAVPARALRGYLETFRHGMPPHGGFAIGLERLVGRLVEAENIREVTLFPRDLHRLAP